MERPLLVILAVVAVTGLLTIGFAHSRNMMGTTESSYQTGQIMDHQSLCSTGALYFGEVVWADQSTHRMMISGFDGNKIFDVSEAAMKGLPRVNHFARVEYTLVNGERIASSVASVPANEAYLYTPQSYAGQA
jgi:hypothetical protein